jgi:hypothetical protein
MTTLIIQEDSLEARSFLQYAKTLSFVEEKKTEKKSFEEASAECHAVSAEVFIEELKERVKQLYRNAKG